ncbi:hypothetical protein ES708_20594 [subsurface metagenome]
MAILKRWTGSLWTPARRILYWNGSAWVERNFKYWTGSVWAIAVTKELWVDYWVRGLWHLNEGSGTNAYDGQSIMNCFSMPCRIIINRVVIIT